MNQGSFGSRCAHVQKIPRQIPRWSLFAFVLTGLFCVTLGSRVELAQANAAPGGPGAPSWWAPANNDFVGTAHSTQSPVWFTGSRGVVGAVFWPTPDTPNTTDLQFMVGDREHTWVDLERDDMSHSTEIGDPNALIWNLTNTDLDHRYEIEKQVYTDPQRSTLIQKVKFTALRGKVGDYLLYALFNPTLANSGNNDSGKTVELREGHKALAAWDSGGSTHSYLAASLPFAAASNGYVGTNDGWTDLRGGIIPDFRMDWQYDRADHGNITQTGRLDLSEYSDCKEVEFTLVLSFGRTQDEAAETARATLRADADRLADRYVEDWSRWTTGLRSLAGPVRDQQYYTALMTLWAHKDKESGAFVAGLGNPWGETQGDGSNGGYHLVWARDLYHVAGALLAAGDTATPKATVDWLFNVQQKQDGSFPQNSWIDGTPYWTSQQLDETAFPILLAYRTGRTDAAFYWQKIKPAAEYLLLNGPRSQQERWEEAPGFSPSTLASVVAGLVVAGKIAENNSDLAGRDRYYDTADYIQAMTPNWTFTKSGPFSDNGYFLRTTAWGDPETPSQIRIANGGGVWDHRTIVDGGFLELVRLGVRSADDPYVTASVPVVNKTIGEKINFDLLSESGMRAGPTVAGEFWFRYNHDGYGEKQDGFNFDGSGRGRLWPLLTGEQGHYLAARGGDPSAHLRTLRLAATESGMIPEQVWSSEDEEGGHEPGTPTKAMMPLAWAMAEYVSLALTGETGSVSGMPSVVHQRYVTHGFTPQVGRDLEWDEDRARQGDALTIYYSGQLAKFDAPLTLHWMTVGKDGGLIGNSRRMIRRADGWWEATVAVPIDGKKIEAFVTGKYRTASHSVPHYMIEVKPRAVRPVGAHVEVFPNPPVAGHKAKVFYNGPLADASDVSLLRGNDGWQAGSAEAVPMSKREDGIWEAEFVASATEAVDLAFYNGGGAWDNNRGMDWHFAVTPR